MCATPLDITDWSTYLRLFTLLLCDMKVEDQQHDSVRIAVGQVYERVKGKTGDLTEAQRQNVSLALENMAAVTCILWPDSQKTADVGQL